MARSARFFACSAILVGKKQLSLIFLRKGKNRRETNDFASSHLNMKRMGQWIKFNNLTIE